MLGLWEVAIEVAFLVSSRTRLALLLLLPKTPGTFLPLVMLLEVCCTVAPFGLTLGGQYIIRNLVIICCALIIGRTALRCTEVRPDAPIATPRPQRDHDAVDSIRPTPRLHSGKICR